MRVCAVFNQTFGERLHNLDLAYPIWIVQSGANDAVVSELWSAKTGDITSFKPQPFDQLIDTLDQHHPGWSELDVYGVTPERAKPALVDYGDGVYSETPDGFIFRRRVQ